MVCRVVYLKRKTTNTQTVSQEFHTTTKNYTIYYPLFQLNLLNNIKNSFNSLDEVYYKIYIYFSFI